MSDDASARPLERGARSTLYLRDDGVLVRRYHDTGAWGEPFEPHRDHAGTLRGPGNRTLASLQGTSALRRRPSSHRAPPDRGGDAEGRGEGRAESRGEAPDDDDERAVVLDDDERTVVRDDDERAVVLDDDDALTRDSSAARRHAPAYLKRALAHLCDLAPTTIDVFARTCGVGSSTAWSYACRVVETWPHAAPLARTLVHPSMLEACRATDDLSGGLRDLGARLPVTGDTELRCLADRYAHLRLARLCVEAER